MKKRDKYKIRVSGLLVDVSEEIYLTYYQMERRAKYLKEKDDLNGVVSYNELDTDDMLGEETMPDLQSESVEDMAIHALMCKKLYQCIKQLSSDDQKLIQLIYFDCKSERQISARTGIPQKTINDRRHKILAQMKKLLEE